MQDQRATGLLDARQDRFLVQRRQRAQVDYFDVEPFLLQLFGRVERSQNLPAESNDGDVAAFTSHASLSDLDDEIVFRKFFAQTRQAIKLLVLKIKNRIGIANRGFDQALCIVRS